MEIVTFSLANFRSIQKSERLTLSNRTVLVGPNNEGKSNILRALVTCVRYLCSERPHTLLTSDWDYVWYRDFPVALQEKHPEGESTFLLEFRLTELERADFKAQVGSKINELLPVHIRWSSQGPKMEVLKQGPGQKVLTNNAVRIRRFMARHLRIEHIPAVRTAEEAQRVASELIQVELAAVENAPEYKEALEAIRTLQRPILDKLGRKLGASLKEFLPDIKSVKVQISTDARRRALRETYSITVDDGTPTLLNKKGDGVQSLAALALMKHAATPQQGGATLFLAIEEPESHLHPSAIHRLQSVIREISTQHQVVLTTHCPLLVDRSNIEANIIVNNKRANAARSVQAIRDALGVRISDNLHNADIVLIVEGEDDRKSLTSIFRSHSATLKLALDNGLLAIDSLAGASNLTYKLQLLRDSFCQTVVLMDNDAAGISATKKAIADGLLLAGDVFHTTMPGPKESEFEDLLHERLYAAELELRLGFALPKPNVKEAKMKWSTRTQTIARRHGKLLDDVDMMSLKMRVAELVVAEPGNALKSWARQPIDSLIEELERRVKSLQLQQAKGR